MDEARNYEMNSQGQFGHSAIYFSSSREAYRLERAGRVWYSLFSETMHEYIQIVQFIMHY